METQKGVFVVKESVSSCFKMTDKYNGFFSADELEFFNADELENIFQDQAMNWFMANVTDERFEQYEQFCENRHSRNNKPHKENSFLHLVDCP
jgi:hypothetical protein